MKTLTIFMFSVIIVISAFLLWAFVGGVIILSNPDSSIYKATIEAAQKENPNAEIMDREKAAIGLLSLIYFPIIYLTGSIGILFFKKWARILIIIAPLICLIYDIIIAPVVLNIPNQTPLKSVLVTYVMIVIPSIYLLLSKVKKQFI